MIANTMRLIVLAAALFAGPAFAQPVTTKPSATDMLTANCPSPRVIIGGSVSLGCSNVAITNPASLATLTLGSGKTITISNTVTFTATDGATLAIGGGGTLGSNAYTSTAYAPLASPSFTGTVTFPDSSTISSSGLSGTAINSSSIGATTASTGRFITVNGLTITANGTNTLNIAAGKTLTDTSGIGASILLGATGGGFTALVGNSCTNQVGTGISAAGVLTCSSITNSFLTTGTFSNITGVGTLTAGATGAGFTVALTTSTVTGNLPIANAPSTAANTVLGNGTGGAAPMTALAVGSCSTASSALIWTTNTGFNCNTSITANAVPAANLTGTTLASAVTASSLTSLGTLTSLTVSGPATFSFTSSLGSGTNAGISGSGSRTTISGTSDTTYGFSYTFSDNGTTTPVATSAFAITSIFSNSANVSTFNSGFRSQVQVTANLGSVDNLFLGATLFGGLTGTYNAMHITVPAAAGGTVTTKNAILIDANAGPITQNNGTASVSKTTGDIIIGGTGGLGVGGAIFTNTLNVIAMADNTGAQTGYVCYNSGTGLLTYDGTNTCLVSTGRFKRITSHVTIALDGIVRMDPVSFFYTRDDLPKDEQVGLIAEAVAAIDPRLVSYDDEGKPRGIREMAVLAKTIAAIKELKADNDNLRERLDRSERRSR